MTKTLDHASSYAPHSSTLANGLPEAKPDANRWAPIPLDNREYRDMREFGLLMADPDERIAVLRRLRMQRDLLAATMRPTSRAGITCALAAMVMLHAIRRPRDEEDYKLKEFHALIHHQDREIRIPLVIATCRAADPPECGPRSDHHPADPLEWMRLHIAFHLSLDLSRVLPDADGLRLQTALGRLWEERDGLRHAILRLFAFRNTFRRGQADPEIRDGFLLTLDALVLLYAARPATTRCEAHYKAAIVNDHHCRDTDHLGAVLAALLEADRVTLGLGVDELA